jgi:seryl-tRNA synthetase
MIDIKLIRNEETFKLIKKDFLKRDLTPLLDNFSKREILNFNDEKLLELVDKYENEYTLKLEELKKLDELWRKTLKNLEEKRALRNKLSKEISEFYKKGETNKSEEFKEKVKILKSEIEKLEEEIRNLEQQIKKLKLQLPNLVDKEVPLGFDEEDNKELYITTPQKIKVLKNNEELIKEFEKKGVEFEIVNEVFHHYYLEENNLIDTKKAGEISESRFYFEFDDIALLDLALINFSVEHFIKELRRRNIKFKVVIPPYMVRKEIEEGATTLDAFEEAIYKIEDENLYLIPTAEHVLAGYFKDKLLEEKDLPLVLIGISPAFRKEAGAHGKDTKGIFRVHQFHKIELYAITKEGEDKKIMRELINIAESLLITLKIPYRRIKICSGDMDKKARYQEDLEAWFPGQQKFREIGSYAYLGDWQARRLNIRYLKNDERIYVNTAYATGIAIQRIICSLVENYYDENKKVIKIPQILRKYLPIKEEIPVKIPSEVKEN